MVIVGIIIAKLIFRQHLVNAFAPMAAKMFILNYMFAVNFELGSTEVCRYTNEKLEISEEFLEGIEGRLLGTGADGYQRRKFRGDIQKEYASATLTQEIMVEGKPPRETHLYLSLHDRYVYNLKDKVLDPFLENVCDANIYDHSGKAYN